MKKSIPRKIVGCIGKCTSNLTSEELDRITDNIQQTLTDVKGRKILREFLKLQNRRDDLDCLNFYEKCCEYIDKEVDYHKSTKEPSLKFLIADVNEAMLIAENLDGTPEIDMAMLEKFNEILTRPDSSRESMLSLLEETKIRLLNHLRHVHQDFRSYALMPCPRGP